MGMLSRENGAKMYLGCDDNYGALRTAYGSVSGSRSCNMFKEFQILRMARIQEAKVWK